MTAAAFGLLRLPGGITISRRRIATLAHQVVQKRKTAIVESNTSAADRNTGY
jgi:hypothetical protein